MKLNLNGWKKVNSEKDHSILQNKDGHQLKVLHKALGKDTRKQLDKLEFANGGDVNPEEKSSQPKSKPVDDVPEADPKKAKEVEKGATDSGWRPAEWKANLKAGLGLAQGGKVQRFANGEEVLPPDADTDTSDPTPAYASQDPQTDAAIPGAQQIASTWTDPAPAAENASPSPDQAAAMPQPEPDAAGQPPQGMTPMDPNAPGSEDAFSMQKNAAIGLGKNESERLKKDAELHKKEAQNLELYAAKKQKEDQDTYSHALTEGHDLANEKIDPEKFWESHSKVQAAIGLALSSFGGTGEAAMNFLNNQINRSVDAQKHNLDNKKSLLAMNMKIYGDKSAAEDVTRAAGAAAVAHKLMANAAKSGSADAELKAKMYVGQMMQQYQPLMDRAATIKTLNSGAAENMDPAQFINQVVKPDQQKAVAEAIDVAKETRKSSIGIMSAFERAVKDNTLVKSIGGIRTPGSVMALHALLGPTFKDVEGTVRQAAMDNLFKNITPGMGDGDKKVQERRQALRGYIQSKGESAIATANGVPLSRFKSTRPLSDKELMDIQNGGAEKAVAEPKYDNMNGVKHQQVVINGKKGWLPVK